MNLPPPPPTPQLLPVFSSHSTHPHSLTQTPKQKRVFTNSSPALPVYGGQSKLLGVSPIACGAPAGKERPFILDMAPSVAARGKIYKAKRRGEKIPMDWALDGEGEFF